MQLIQLIVPAEAAHDTVEVLGELGLVQFKDLNPDKSTFQRTYANQVRHQQVIQLCTWPRRGAGGFSLGCWGGASLHSCARGLNGVLGGTHRGAEGVLSAIDVSAADDSCIRG